MRLGNISYGVYLLQGLVLFAASPLLRPDISILYGGVIATAVASLMVVAAVAHILIERPGIALGKSLARRLSSKA